MTNEHISLALQYLDDDLLMETQSLRSKKHGGTSMKKRFTILIAAVLITTLCCATAFATVSGGWFADVKNGFGAVTGTEYHNATEEISVAAEVGTDLLTVSITFLFPDQFPYREVETLRIGEFTIDNKNFSQTDAAPIINGMAQLPISIGDLTAGKHTLHITSLIGEKKAEQPLPIYGDWECEFTVE